MSIISDEQYIFDKKGRATAVILPIAKYERILSALGETGEMSETELLSQSPEFEKLVRQGMDDIRAGRFRHWREVWDDI